MGGISSPHWAAFFEAMQQDGATVVDSPGAAHSKMGRPETPTYKAMCVSQAARVFRV